MAHSEGMPTWRDLQVGAIVTQPGSAKEYRTGDWRLQRPVLDEEKCIKCGFCYIYCPDACYQRDEEGFFRVNLYYCKGCGICAQECPTGAISMVEEE